MRRQRPPGSDPWASFAPGTGGPMARRSLGLQRLPGCATVDGVGSKLLQEPPASLSFMHFCFVCIDALVTGIIKYYVAALSLVSSHSFIAFGQRSFHLFFLGWPTRSKPSQGQTVFCCFRCSLNSVRTICTRNNLFASASNTKPTQQTIQTIAGYCS